MESGEVVVDEECGANECEAAVRERGGERKREMQVRARF